MHNQSIIGEDMDKGKVSRFLAYPVLQKLTKLQC